MAITRRTWTDDDGSGTTGTILDNAELQTIYDTVDARWAEASFTSTGTQNDFGFSQADYLRLNNASALTLTGFAAPATPSKPGKPLLIRSTGAGLVTLANNSGSSSAGNRIFTRSGIDLTLAAGIGCARLVYDTSGFWVVEAHDQGARVAYTTTWTGSAVNPTQGNTVLAANYLIRGKQMIVDIALVWGDSGTGVGTGYWIFTLPYTASTSYVGTGACFVTDASGGQYVGCAYLLSTTTLGALFDTGQLGAILPIASWAAGDIVQLRLECQLA